MSSVHVASKPGLDRLQQTSTGMTMYKKTVCHTDTEVPSYKGDIHCSVVTEASSLKVENVDVKAQWRSAADRRVTTADILVDSYPTFTVSVDCSKYFAEGKQTDDFPDLQATLHFDKEEIATLVTYSAQGHHRLIFDGSILEEYNRSCPKAKAWKPFRFGTSRVSQMSSEVVCKPQVIRIVTKRVKCIALLTTHMSPQHANYEVETFATSVNHTDLRWQYTAFKLSCRLTDLHPTQSKVLHAQLSQQDLVKTPPRLASGYNSLSSSQETPPLYSTQNVRFTQVQPRASGSASNSVLHLKAPHFPFGQTSRVDAGEILREPSDNRWKDEHPRPVMNLKRSRARSTLEYPAYNEADRVVMKKEPEQDEQGGPIRHEPESLVLEITKQVSMIEHGKGTWRYQDLVQGRRNPTIRNWLGPSLFDLPQSSLKMSLASILKTPEPELAKLKKGVSSTYDPGLIFPPPAQRRKRMKF